MARIPDSFTEWTAPWKDEDFDAERAKRLVYNALFDKQSATDDQKATKTKVTELEGELSDTKAASTADDDAQQTIKDLNKKVRDLEAAGSDARPEDQKRIWQLEAALELGLPAKDAARLVGGDKDEILADAKDFAKDHGIDIPGDEDSTSNEEPEAGDKPTSGPPSNSPQSRLRTGFDKGQVTEPSNPSKAAESLPPLFA